MLPEGEVRAISDIRYALVIREKEMFLLTDTEGGVGVNNSSGFGLYHRDTRYLSGWQITLIGVEPVVLLSTAEEGFWMEQVMTNPELVNERGESLPSGSLHIRRQRVLDRSLIESTRFTNYSLVPLHLTVRYEYSADFADIFEIRGLHRRRRGNFLGARLQANGLTFRYRGLDGIARQTRVRFRPDPDELQPQEAFFHLEIPPGGTREIDARVVVDGIAGTGAVRRSIEEVGASHEAWREACTTIVTSNHLFNRSLERAITDLRLLWREWEDGGSFLAAGIPWFDTLFGRDCLLSSYMVLAYRPEIARMVLQTLAARQGNQIDERREEEPGKIIHEVRSCETANTGETVFGRYFGSVDSTPLFLILASEYYRWTGDLEFMRELEPKVAAALAWLDRFADLDADGFVEYVRRNPRGLNNQGWKDSWDAMVDHEGNLLQPPIALVEVQGYVYAARLGIADVYEDLGDVKRAEALRTEAEALRKRINNDFWVPQGHYAMALDGAKRQSRVRSSNAGQLLWTGAPTREKARVQTASLMRSDMFSGWGIRTISSATPRYNPIGYHLGTIWPHDNALIARGLKRYGQEADMNRIATALFEAALSFQYYRLPELFSGAPRQAHQAPVPYPIACRPQAFAAAALPFILTSILGLAPRAPRNQLFVVRPRLPGWLEYVHVSGLRLGSGRVDLAYRRKGRGIQVEVLNKSAGLEVVRLDRWPLP